MATAREDRLRVAADDSPPARLPRREPWRPEIVLACAGLFFVSSDRFLAINLGSLTLKPSYPLFAGSAALVVARNIVRPRRLPRGWPGFVAILGVVLAFYLTATIVSVDRVASIIQLLVILGGAILPFVALAFGPTRRCDLDRLVNALVLGTLAAATFGFYQLAASTLGLPIPANLVYAGAVGGIGRISAWSYEPAFYVFHLEMTIAVVIGDVLVRRRRLRVRPELPALYLLLSLMLANARVGYLSMPLVVVLVFRSSDRSRRLDPRALRFIRVAIAGMAIVVMAGLPFGINFPKYVADRIASVTNTHEAASNGVRVSLYSVGFRLAKERPLLGYGPGASGGPLLANFNSPPGLDPRSFPVNNVALQAVLDAGVGALLGVIGLFALVVRISRRSVSRDARVLAAGLIAVLLVNGMLTSLFWDQRVWAVMGLIYGATRCVRAERAMALASADDEGD